MKRAPAVQLEKHSMWASRPLILDSPGTVKTPFNQYQWGSEKKTHSSAPADKSLQAGRGSSLFLAWSREQKDH